ncbi:hypothetical protein WICPIJ_003499 [Wickerhamomyces pijperi]|uniref:Histone-lysine N-methyltransferase, H3 lysine-79 specific n=1 Tax=Wickerhamomyces pijperi TaxID=599730 RepID=A0A9P8Q9U2_WICPI|nr:hypothetical protein WICPIJ_003499 [Wickerhamomyces pijperi]
MKRISHGIDHEPSTSSKRFRRAPLTPIRPTDTTVLQRKPVYSESLIAKLNSNAYLTPNQILAKARYEEHYQELISDWKSKYFSSQRSDKTYGEFTPIFVDLIYCLESFKPQTHVIDIGSGSGNICIYSSLVYGYESTGFESVPQLSTKASSFRNSFSNNQLFQHLPTQFVNKDASHLYEYKHIFKKSSIVFFNNKKIEASIQSKIVENFFYLPTNAIIISTEPVIPLSLHVSDNSNSRLEEFFLKCKQVELPYPPGAVDWSSKKGTYYRTEIMSRRLKEYTIRKSGRTTNKQK